MSFVFTLVGFGIRQSLDLDERTESGIIQAVRGHFVNHAQTLPRALMRAHDRAWQALGYALAGDSLFKRFTSLFTSADDKGFREEVKLFIQERAQLVGREPDELRQACLQDLKTLRSSGKLSPQTLTGEEVARAAAGFRRYAELQGLVDGAMQAVEQIAGQLEPDYPQLARLLKQPEPSRPPLLVAAFSFFFRREVEKDDELANGLMVDGLRRLAQSQSRGLAELERALEQLGEQIEQGFTDVLGELKGLQAGIGAVVITSRQTQATVEQLAREVREMLGRTQIPSGEVRPQYAVSIRNPDEKRVVQAMLERFRHLSAEEQQNMPGLLNDLGKLLHGAGDATRARETFVDAAKLTEDQEVRAETLYNAYRSALEGRQYEAALGHLSEAAQLAPNRFAPFPMWRYQPRRILGAGGFGVVFQCYDINFKEEVAVKSLHIGELDRNITDVFSEAQVLRRVNHPHIIGVHDCEFADPIGRHRPYIVMDYFPGTSLQSVLDREGKLTPELLLPVALAIVEGMQAAHARGILHRDLKPDNVLVLREGDEWVVRIVDFGLALRRQTIETSMAVRSHTSTVMGESVAGTVKYAPPEQLGELVDGKRIEPGPYSDVFAFGKLCCQALFGNPHPSRREWASLPGDLADVLENCIIYSLEHRHKNFAPVLEVLRKFDPRKKREEEELRLREEARRQDEARRQEEARRQDEARRQEEVRRQDEGRRQQEAQRQREAEARVAEQQRQERERLAAEQARQEKQRREQEEARRQHAEQLLAQRVWQILVRSHGRPTAADNTEVGELVRQQQVARDRAEVIIRDTRQRWQTTRPVSRRPGEVCVVPLGGGADVRLAWIPAGSFQMGSPDTEEKRDADEGPVHRVTLSRGFWMGIYPVTQQQWLALLPSNPSRFKGDSRPVEQVSFKAACEFCQALAAKTGKRFRLPTEAEWEYACRAGTTTVFSFGNAASADEANFDGNFPYGGAAARSWRNATTAVGTFAPNAWGVYDMHGNVWEWCLDYYSETTYKDAGPAARDPTGPSKGDARVIRGGSWFSWGWSCRSASRDKTAHDSATPGNVGLRVMMEGD